MRNFPLLRFILFQIGCASVFAETLYISGQDATNLPIYWKIEPPNTASTKETLDVAGASAGSGLGIQFSPSQRVWISGQQALVETSGACYWTIAPPNPASSLNALGNNETTNAYANSVAFNASGFGCLAGVDDAGNAAYWTISPSGVVAGPVELTSNGFGIGVAFASSGNGFIAGMNGDSQATYWPLSDTGTVGTAVLLPDGAANGTSVYAVAVSPSGIIYILGSTQDGFACYWTDVISGTPSPTVHVLNGVGSNSSARGIAFLSSGEGMIVGQGSGNTCVYWPIASDGTVGSIQLLPHGSGSGSSAYAVAYSADKTAYIIGRDDLNNAVYWTVSPSDTIGYEILTDGAGASAYAIAAPFSSLSPPSNLSASYVINDFALLYEYCALLRWTPSSSQDVIAYNIFQNGTKIGTVNRSTTQYKNHDQNPSQSSVYSVKAVDSLGNESAAASVILN